MPTANDSDVPDLQSALGRVAAFGLPGADAPSADVFRRLPAPGIWSFLARHRLVGLIVAAADAQPDLLTDEQRDYLRERIDQRVRLLLALERELARLVEVLADAGVPVGAVKGPALGRALYPVSWWRDFGDLDLLVPADRLADARKVLSDDGVVPVVPPATEHSPRLLGKGITLRATTGFEVDLHHTLLAGAFGFGRSWDFWMAEPTVVEIAGVDVLTTGLTHTAVHMLAHLVIGGPVVSYHTARDVAEVLRRFEPDDDQGARVRSLVAELGLDGLVEAAVDRCDAILHWLPPTWREWRENRTIPETWPAVSETFRRQTESFGAVVLASLKVHHNPRDVGRIVRAVVWPSSDHLHARGRSRLGWIGGAVDVLRPPAHS